ncbi:MAG: ribosome-associated protein [Limisphaerales bacterium]|jgi:ribosome-associated protein
MPNSRASTLPAEACQFKFVHASGPGGQHVNKASTAVELRVHINKLGLPPSVTHRLVSQQRNRINKDGELVVQADQFRSQLKNKQAAIGRVEEWLNAARIIPKRRVATKPSRASKTRRLSHKKQRGQVKSNRKKPNSLD